MTRWPSARSVKICRCPRWQKRETCLCGWPVVWKVGANSIIIATTTVNIHTGNHLWKRIVSREAWVRKSLPRFREHGPRRHPAVLWLVRSALCTFEARSGGKFVLGPRKLSGKEDARCAPKVENNGRICVSYFTILSLRPGNGLRWVSFHFILFILFWFRVKQAKYRRFIFIATIMRRLQSWA